MVVCFSHLRSFPWCFDEMIALSSYVTLFSNVVGGQRTTFRNQLSSSNFTLVANYKIVILIVCHKLINVKECFPKISAEYIFPLHLMLVCQYEPFSPTLFSYLSHCYFPVELPCYVLISYNVWSQQSIGRKKNQKREGKKYYSQSLFPFSLQNRKTCEHLIAQAAFSKFLHFLVGPNAENVSIFVSYVWHRS